jgi:hypothetical protein
VYDPWYAGSYSYGSYGGYGYGGYGGYGGQAYDEGAVRLKISPRDAQVLVNGYHVGVVDEFDGTFQRLRLPEGPHEIDVQLVGFEPLAFKVYVTRDRTLTLRGELQPRRP